MFQEAMKRRLGRSGIFVEVDGKYYLNEERLKEIEEQRRGQGAAWGSRDRMFTLRIARMVMAVMLIALVLVNVLVHSWELTMTVAFLMLAWLAVTILQIYYVSRTRRRLQSF
jgi:hypothetical protein